MSQLRQDPISGQWVIIAPERAGRPDDFGRVREPQASGPCPFCAGHEHLTPPAILELPAEQTAAHNNGESTNAAPRWRVRVLENKFPAVTLADATAAGNGEPPAITAEADDGLPGPLAAALGRHEVVIESPRHVAGITDLSSTQMADVVGVYRDRLAELKQDRRLVSGLVFKNMGAQSGATLEHIHSQIVALPTVPDRLRAELTGAAQWRERHGRCPFCALVDREVADGARLIAANDRFVALCPWAARMPYETWIIPREHESHFENITTPAAAELASILQEVVAAIQDAAGQGAYNYLIHSAPFDTPSGDHYHWHVEVIPRITRLAGFELGTGWFINPLPPEAAAEQIRKSIVAAKEKRSSSESFPIR